MFWIFRRGPRRLGSDSHPETTYRQSPQVAAVESTFNTKHCCGQGRPGVSPLTKLLASVFIQILYPSPPLPENRSPRSEQGTDVSPNYHLYFYSYHIDKPLATAAVCSRPRLRHTPECRMFRAAARATPTPSHPPRLRLRGAGRTARRGKTSSR